MNYDHPMAFDSAEERVPGDFEFERVPMRIARYIRGRKGGERRWEILTEPNKLTGYQTVLTQQVVPEGASRAEHLKLALARTGELPSDLEIGALWGRICERLNG